MNSKLLNQFKEYLEKQDVLNKLTESQKLNEYGYSEIHTIMYIHDLDHPNVTTIAENLNMTRGAISKITKKLLAKNLIESYTIAENKQKIFFKLTEQGKSLYKEHDKRHKEWALRDLNFFQQFSEDELTVIERFMTAYNDHLNDEIRFLEKDENEK